MDWEEKWAERKWNVEGNGIMVCISNWGRRDDGFIWQTSKLVLLPKASNEPLPAESIFKMSQKGKKIVSLKDFFVFSSFCLSFVKLLYHYFVVFYYWNFKSIHLLHDLSNSTEFTFLFDFT